MEGIPADKQHELNKYVDLVNGKLKDEFHKLKNYIHMKVMAEEMILVIIDDIIKKGKEIRKEVRNDNLLQ